jgi:hypothetical protein
MAETWEHPLQSLAVSAVVHVAGLQLQSAQRIRANDIGDFSGVFSR